MEQQHTRRPQQVPPVEVYAPAARRFHWWTVAALAVQVPLGFAMVAYGAATGFASPTGTMYDAHKVLGLLILLLAIARLANRLIRGAPADEPTLAPIQKLAAHVTHWAIYLLLIMVPIIGWRAVSLYGEFAPFGIRLPSLATPAGDAAAAPAFFFHKAAAVLLVLAVGAHVGAALFHHLIRKDDVLARMLPRLLRSRRDVA